MGPVRNRRRRGRGRRALPLSLRVAAIYAMLVAATLLVVAGLAIQFTRNQVGNQVRDTLTSYATSFRQNVPSGVSGEVGSGTPVEQALEDAGARWIKQQPFSAAQTAYLEVAGYSYLSHGALGTLIVPDPALREVLQGTSQKWFNYAQGGTQIRMLRLPVKVGPNTTGVLLLAVSQTAALRSSNLSLLKDVAVASIIGLIFASAVGFVAVRRTLRPLEAMAQEVESIQESNDLSKRLSGYGPLDEVGRLAEAFDRMLGRLQDSFLSQRRFLSDASHELRTPMTVVRGQLELLAMDIESLPGRRSMSIAIEELDRMGRIVEDLLLLARLDEGMPLARQSVEVELVVGEALLRGMLTGAEVDVEIPPGLTVEADPDRLLQVLTNLVTNAVKHASGSLILVSASQLADSVRIDVSDRGPGIDPADLPHVFERLYRGAKQRSEDPRGAGQGAGLGLAIAKSLVEAMGGRINVASRLGVGTTFTVILHAGEPILQVRPLAGAQG
ncbi:MAG: ATP-binding protein [Actinomycetota bacterium]